MPIDHETPTARPRRLALTHGPAGTPAATVWAIAGTVGALGYAALKLAWGFGSDIGILDEQALESSVIGSLGWLATWGTLVPAVLAIAILWMRARLAGPQRVLRVLCIAGAAVLLVPALVGFVGALGVELGIVSDDPTPDLANAVFLYVYGCFLILLAAFASLARPASPAR